MHIDALNPTDPWDSHLTPGSSPASIGFDDFNDYDTDQALACQYDTEEQLFSLDSCFDSFFESQPDFSSPYELPDLSQRAVSPSVTSLDRAFSSEIAGYDFSTVHTFASPIWPSDENEHPRSFFKLSGVAKDADKPSKWRSVDNLESHGPKLSQPGKAAGGTTEKLDIPEK
ncbi:zinc finger MSN2 [Fusarium coicis]|nr:zinc finger MSN2 [Fusarium coicis]